MPFNGSDPRAHIASRRLEYRNIVDRIPDFPVYSDDQNVSANYAGSNRRYDKLEMLIYENIVP